MTHTYCCVYSAKTPDEGQKTCLKHVEFYSKNKFEELVHLVGFITRIVELTELGSVPWRSKTFAVVSELLSTYISGTFIRQFWGQNQVAFFWPIENVFGLILRHVEMYSVRRCINIHVNLRTLFCCSYLNGPHRRMLPLWQNYLAVDVLYEMLIYWRAECLIV